MSKIPSDINDLINKNEQERIVCLRELFDVLSTNLPVGFTPCISYGMVSFAVPHSLYPNGYHCDPKQPLPFISFAAKKNHISLHHMGLYAQDEDGKNAVLDWFVSEWTITVQRNWIWERVVSVLKNPRIFRLH